ncbi:hypothetical protein CEXT_641721 [Caerostris extrusa]|uniref:Uncharacterized protein n=1 Tax=Caerostris extrusa TaxID=172846 RepID=A0AAV4VL86_CAEEX|nr:hypothetical protein CEXT_641721 [Caerostris extrusa]
MIQILSLHIKDDVDIKPLMQLKELRNLNIESIYETFCPLADLNEILRSIGGKLQNLRFYSDNPVSLNFVFKCCPNLRSAEFNCDVFGEDTECPESAENVRRLKITLFERSYNRPIDVRVFAVTLSKCINLEELEIYSTTSQISARTYVHVYDQVYHQDLYDNMLDIILSKKPFMKLKRYLSNGLICLTMVCKHLLSTLEIWK